MEKQDDVYFRGGGAAGGLWRHQQWSPSWPLSWILPEIRSQVKTARNVIFCPLHEKLHIVSTLHDFSHNIYFNCWKKLKKHVFSSKIPRVKAANLIFCVNWRKKNKDNKVQRLFCNMYIGKEGFSTLKQIGGLVRNRCFTLNKTGEISLWTGAVERRQFSVTGPGSNR